MKLLPIALCCPLLLLGCGNEQHDDIRQWMEEESKNMRSGLTQPPPLSPPPIVSYGSKDLESPFSPDKIRVKDATNLGSEKGNPVAGRPPEYLEGFPLESLRLIGVINFSGRMFALIQTPEKPKHVTIGNYIGPNYGKITEITKTEMRITETVKDANDLWVKRDKVLYLQQDEGVKK